MHLLVKDEKRVVLSYGKEAIRKAYMQQYAWVLYYMFRDLVLPEGFPSKFLIENALKIVRNRRSCNRDIGASKTYIKLHGNKGNEYDEE